MSQKLGNLEISIKIKEKTYTLKPQNLTSRKSVPQKLKHHYEILCNQIYVVNVSQGRKKRKKKTKQTPKKPETKVENYGLSTLWNIKYLSKKVLELYQLTRIFFHNVLLKEKSDAESTLKKKKKLTISKSLFIDVCTHASLF